MAKLELAKRLRLVDGLMQSQALTLQQGHVAAVDQNGLVFAGFRPPLAVRDRVMVRDRRGRPLLAEVVSADGQLARAALFGEAEGLASGTRAESLPSQGLPVSAEWLGRVLDPLGRPMDGRPMPTPSLRRSPTRCAPPPPGVRQRLGAPVSLGVRAIDCFCTIREGQRLGLFAASGVGKSTLLATMARSTSFDVTVLAMVGERGRELREFLEDDLGAEGLRRSVVVCATSDAPAALRREATYAAMAIAEHFRDEGKRVLLLLDSITRFAHACREIGLAAGEPPATRGYPPSVFGELPAVLERAGPGAPGAGSITALMTVLVDGDDHDEPIADAVRGTLDGHVVLDRRIAESGRYPAVNVLRSLSRTVPGCQTRDQMDLATRARRLLLLSDSVADLVRLGAYRVGTDPETDLALRLAPKIEVVLRQQKGEVGSLDDAFRALGEAMNDESP